ncbi:YihY/virulence factor BrkB family protein [Noviherbaspirillum galbum]|uniref:YihY/virulence factor BrkB family protein n=1 Tax=Noviherbaspirillum galbum TaxID=2709383 RepID=A0A6B3SZE7_9BURK|nr:YihY/virulence factor BrkB family protein [Noviherbaspirillum galbum]NEX63989.1 YihY/virulence factor BrkB family protein [Noviherbaspirillum galbum]
MAITHPSSHQPRIARQGDKKRLFVAVARLVAVSLTAWQRHNRPAGPAARAIALPSLHARQTAAEKQPEQARETRAAPGNEEKAADQKKQDLRKLPYPKALLRILIDAAKEWSDHRAASKGAALALYTLFSLAPMLVLVVTIAGFFFGEDTVRQQLLVQMSNLMGTQGADAIKTILAGAKHEDSSAIAGLVSAALVLVSATTAFAELKESLDELWEVRKKETSGIWSLLRERFLSLGLVMVLALMALSSLAVSTALAAMGNVWGGGAFKVVSQIISNVVAFAILSGLFAAIFKYLPAVKLNWRDVIVGAVLTAILFSVGKLAIGLYVSKADISSSYGAAGSVVILITWIYYSAQIFFYGSLFTHEYATRLGSRSARSEGGKAANAAVNTASKTPALVRAY